MPDSKSKTTAKPCGRDGCGDDLLCHRPDCPLVTISVGLGLTRIMTRAAFVSGLQAFALIKHVAVTIANKRTERVQNESDPSSQATDRRHPIDIIDGVLRPLLGSLPGTTAAVSTWIALRREGYLMDAPEGEIDDE